MYYNRHFKCIDSRQKSIILIFSAMERDEHIYYMIKTSSVFCNLSTKASQLPLCVSDEKRCFVAGVFQNARSQALPKLVLPWQAAK